MRRSALITVAALLILAVGLAQRHRDQREFTTSSGEAHDLYREGNEALLSFQYGKAEDALQRALELDPGFAMAQAALAELFGMQGMEAADRAYARAESLALLLPDEDERLLVQLRLSRRSDASSARDSLLVLLDERLPRHPIVMTTHAMVAMARNEGERAAQLWREILADNPNYARAYNYLGYNAAYMGRYDEALEYLKKYAYLAPDLANPHDSLGEVLSLVGRYEDAEREFRKALEIQPDFSHSIVYLAVTYLRRGRLEKGLGILEQLRGQVAGTGYEWLIDGQLIEFYYEHEMYSRLRDVMLATAARAPDSWSSRRYVALARLIDGEYEAGQALHDSLIAAMRAERDLEENPNLEQALIRLEASYRAGVAMRRGDDETALRYWEEVAAHSADLRPHDRLDIEYRLGGALAAVGRHEDALPLARQILQLNPRYLPGLLLQARALVALERWDEARTAVTMLQGALSIADRDFRPVAVADSLAEVVRRRTSS